MGEGEGGAFYTQGGSLGLFFRIKESSDTLFKTNPDYSCLPTDRNNPGYVISFVMMAEAASGGMGGGGGDLRQ